MSTVLDIIGLLVAVSAGATAVVLFMGLWTLGASEATNAAYSNVMMRWRVGLQGLTLGLLAVYFVVQQFA